MPGPPAQRRSYLMSITIKCLRRPAARRLLLGSLSLGAAAAVTVSATSVPGVGTILVNGQGQTLYLLTSEQGGKVTCTRANGCTKFWPETLLASGVTAAKAGSGVQASMLGTVTDASGNLEVTYNHWPLYTFVKDSGPGMAHGQGLTGFGGTWYVLNASGNPVTSSQSQAGSSSSAAAVNVSAQSAAGVRTILAD